MTYTSLKPQTSKYWRINSDSTNPRSVAKFVLVNLAPDIIEKVLSGDAPQKLTMERLKGSIPDLWS